MTDELEARFHEETLRNCDQAKPDYNPTYWRRVVTMARIDDRPLFYVAAQTFVDRALRADDSLFTPGVAIWTAANLQDLYQRFIGHPDESHDIFVIKFQRQLSGSPPTDRY